MLQKKRSTINKVPGEPDNKKVAIKIGILLSILTISALVPIVSKFIPKKASVPSVLGGESKAAAKEAPKIPDIETIKKYVTLEKIIEKAQELAGNIEEKVLGQASEAVGKAAEETKEKVQDSIIDAALKPLVDKIEELPEAQQDKVKEAICK